MTLNLEQMAITTLKSAVISNFFGISTPKAIALYTLGGCVAEVATELFESKIVSRFNFEFDGISKLGALVLIAIPKAMISHYVGKALAKTVTNVEVTAKNGIQLAAGMHSMLALIYSIKLLSAQK